MFGLDKIFGGDGLFGKFFDSIGLGWMGNVMSLAVNVMTGNWLAAAKDVFDLVSQFSSSWSKNVTPFQPLGEFASGGCFGDLTGDRMSDIIGGSDFSDTVSRGLNIIQETILGRDQIVYSQRSAISAARV
ncbi:MAG TPA: hypothetical protein VN282_07125 [Pyrinomonadaceae bacterium]|nr:hypothetical protein [Pyrinomonadaceae bacterium]